MYKFHPEKSIRLSLLNYQDQEWMVNIPLYAVFDISPWPGDSYYPTDVIS